MEEEHPDWKNLQDDVIRIRKIYVTKSPQWRYQKAVELADNPDAAAHRLVAHVSAVEGLARSLLIHEKYQDPRMRLEQYEIEFKRKRAETLIDDYLKAKNLPEAAIVFGEEVWEKFKVATQYRNLVVHECAYHDVSKSHWTIGACQSVFKKLGQFSDFVEQ